MISRQNKKNSNNNNNDRQLQDGLSFFEDPDTGLKACIALHDMALGPAFGGCRMYNYPDEDAAMADALRLAEGMTYKNAVAGLPLGGGTAVIIGNPYVNKSPDLFAALGRAIGSLEGRFIGIEDMGTESDDIFQIHQATSYVGGLFNPEIDGFSKEGETVPQATAYGVFCGMKAVAARLYGGDTLAGLKIAVQGLGSVGYHMVSLLYNAGAEVIVTDIDHRKAERALGDFPGIVAVGPQDIFSVEANIFAPCAVGGQLNDNTIPQMHFDIVAGAANGQLARAHHDEILSAHEILYVPDYVINSGGVIASAYEYFHRAGESPFGHPLTPEHLFAHIERIGDRVHEVFDLAEQEGITPCAAADRIAEGIFRVV